MQGFLTYFNIALGVISTILAFLPFIYLLVGVWLKIFKKQRNSKNDTNHKNHKFAVLIPARNEINVIANLISSLKQQNYPSDLFDIYVIADNCTDNTKEVALKAGAFVIERHDTEKVGKGYTLDYAIKHINSLSQDQLPNSFKYDAFIFFDADNVVDKDFLKYINIEYAKGYKVVTSYRMPKNYSDSWIAAASGLMYIRESIFLQEPKRALKISCSISGTGFLVDSELLKDGWKYHLLSEEIQFTADKVINGLKIGNAKDAVTYDEQPSDVKTFFRQRLRWAKGTMQVFNKYSGKLFLKTFKSLSSWDIFTYIFPINFLILLAFLVNFIVMVVGYSTNNISLGNHALIAFGFSVGSTYLVPLMFGFITTIFEWKRIKAPFYKKIWYCFLFPIITFFWIFIWVWALFQRKLQWKPIKHKDSKNIEQMQ